MTRELHWLVAVTLLVGWVSAAPLELPQTYGPPRRPPPPSPPPPTVSFVSDLALPSSSAPIGGREGARAGLQQYEPTALSAVPGAKTSRRGTLVAATRELSVSDVPYDLALVNAEGFRVRPSELTGHLPFTLPANVPPLPAGAQRSVPPPQAAPGPPPQAAPGPPPQAAPGPSPQAIPVPPSPHTIVTYYSLGNEAKVQMLPYLKLVERLVGKQAYGPPATLRTPTPPAPEPVSLPEETFPTNAVPSPAKVYGDPGSSK